jgi:nicotinate-nucleotide pyrophosphorylase (carboxylating)
MGGGDRVQVRDWLAEDVPSFDIGGAVVGETLEEALLLMKESGVVAGVPFVNAVFEELACT